MTSNETIVIRPRPTVTVIALAVAALAVGLSAIGFTLWGSSAAAAAPSGCGGPKLTLQGTGTASGAPNELVESLAVSVNADTVAAALAQDNAAAQSVYNVLGIYGFTKRDVQTQDFSINPNYSFPHGTQVLTGYNVSNSLNVTIKKLSDAGEIIDALAKAAGNDISVNSLSFTNSDPRGLQDRARLDAVRQATSHARALAAGAGDRLGRLCSLRDDQSVQPVYPVYANAASAPGLAALPTKVALSGGTETESDQVTAVFALMPS